jgi:hypothetical protein
LAVTVGLAGANVSGPGPQATTHTSAPMLKIVDVRMGFAPSLPKSMLNTYSNGPPATMSGTLVEHAHR